MRLRMIKVEGQRKRMHVLSSEGSQLRDEAGAQAAHVSLLGIIYRVSLVPYDRIIPHFSFFQHLYQFSIISAIAVALHYRGSVSNLFLERRDKP